MRGVVPAMLVAVVALVLSSCTQATSQNNPSPEASPSTAAASPTPSTSPTPVESPSPADSPSPSPSPSPARLIITSLPFHTGEVGVTYAPVGLGASGGVPPYKWSIATGALPPGLALSTGGSTTGNPTTAGSFSFVVRVDDSGGGAAGVPRTISVVRHLTAAGTCGEGCSVEAGCVTVCGTFGSHSGGLSPYKYSVSSGFLPAGMGLNGLALKGVFPSPPPNSGGFYQFSVTVTDALGATGVAGANIFVFPHIAIDGPSQSCQGGGCTVDYSGGNSGAPTVVISNPTCSPACPGPVPFSGSAAGSVVTISVPGGVLWAGSFDLTISDQSPCGPSAFCISNTVTVVASFNTT